MADVIAILWVLADLAVFGIFIAYRFKSSLPHFLGDLCEWGKTKKKRENTWIFRFSHVPNSFFTHFYLFGLMMNLFFLWDVVLQPCLYNQQSQTIYYLRLCSLSADPVSNPSCLLVTLALILMTVQVSRRLLECLFVHVFTGYIHLLHYLVGLGFYFLVGLSIIGGVPLFKIQQWTGFPAPTS